MDVDYEEVPDTKVCPRCEMEKPLTAYNKKRAECKSCQSVYNHNWREEGSVASTDDLPETKVCSHCKVLKPVTEYNKRRAECKKCQSVYHHRWRGERPNDTSETKVCAQRQVEKPLTEFSKKKDGRLQSQCYCKSCQSSYRNRWNKEKDGIGLMDTSTDDSLYVMSISKLRGIVKVGRSKNPNERAFQLALSHPFLVNVDHQYPGYGFLELVIHRKLLPYRVEDGSGREWFNATGSVADTIIKGVIAEYELSQDMTRVRNAGI